MKKFPVIAVAGLAAVSIAACGSTSEPGAPSDNTPVAQTQTFYDMSVLQSNLKDEVDKRSPNDAVKSVQCFKTGDQTAECNVRGSQGVSDTASVTVHISSDGQQYITSGAGQ